MLLHRRVGIDGEPLPILRKGVLVLRGLLQFGRLPPDRLRPCAGVASLFSAPDERVEALGVFADTFHGVDAHALPVERKGLFEPAFFLYGHRPFDGLPRLAFERRFKAVGVRLHLLVRLNAVGFAVLQQRIVPSPRTLQPLGLVVERRTGGLLRLASRLLLFRRNFGDLRKVVHHRGESGALLQFGGVDFDRVIFVQRQALAILRRGSSKVALVFKAFGLFAKSQRFLQPLQLHFKRRDSFSCPRRSNLASINRRRRGAGLPAGLYDSGRCRRERGFKQMNRRLCGAVATRPVVEDHIAARCGGHPPDDAQGGPDRNRVHESPFGVVYPDGVLRIVVGVHSAFRVGREVLRSEVHLLVARSFRQVASEERPLLQRLSLEVEHREDRGAVVPLLRLRHGKTVAGKRGKPPYLSGFPSREHFALGREDKDARHAAADLREAGDGDRTRFGHRQVRGSVYPVVPDGLLVRTDLLQKLACSREALYMRIDRVPLVDDVKRPVGAEGHRLRIVEGSVLPLPPAPPLGELGALGIEEAYPSLSQAFTDGDRTVVRDRRAVDMPETLLGGAVGERGDRVNGPLRLPRRHQNLLDLVAELLYRGSSPHERDERMLPLRVRADAQDHVAFHLPGDSAHVHLSRKGVENGGLVADGRLLLA